MTEQKLAAIQARADTPMPDTGLKIGVITPLYQHHFDAVHDRAALLAEVRRLRGLIHQAEWAGGDGQTHEVTKCCPWCDAYATREGGHFPDCPAFPPTT